MPTRRTPQPGSRGAAPSGGRSGRPSGEPPRRTRHRAGRRRPRRPVAAPRPRFTNRMAVLVLVAAVLVVSYASSMRAYLEQRSQISDLRAQIASSQTDIEALEREKRRWDDEAYVAAAGAAALRLGDARRDRLPGDRSRREAARAHRLPDRPELRGAARCRSRGGARSTAASRARTTRRRSRRRRPRSVRDRPRTGRRRRRGPARTPTALDPRGRPPLPVRSTRTW